jgi:hypothetical protein
MRHTRANFDTNFLTPFYHNETVKNEKKRIISVKKQLILVHKGQNRVEQL